MTASAPVGLPPPSTQTSTPPAMSGITSGLAQYGRVVVITLVGLFLFNRVGDRLSTDQQETLILLVVAAAFVYSAYKRPAIAVALLLYHSMRHGGWFILAAAPGVLMLTRRHQRLQMHIPANDVHRRRTMLLASLAMVATLPFVAYSLGPWEASARFSPVQSAEPLLQPRRPGDEGLLTRIARYLGFGPDGQPGQPGDIVPVEPAAPPPVDEPFNWWLVVAALLILAVIAVAWWLWRRRRSRTTPAPIGPAALPLARLEAVGAATGRRRRPHEGAITYARALADHTGDARLSAVGPLVSGQVYESAFVRPEQVDTGLGAIESSPPPRPPRPPLATRLAQRARSLPITGRGLLYAALTLAGMALAAALLVPRLGELEPDRFEFGAAGRLVESAIDGE